jgi:leukotriene-A4 hydrolase
MNLDIMAKIDADYDTTADPDPEVKQRWLPTGIMLDYPSALPTAHTWISSMGRAKYLTPVYVALEDHNMHDTGVEWLCENIDFYHPVSISTVERDLGLTDEYECPTSSTVIIQ